ncbi:hypothetical protein JOC93_001610 [Priestia taiwanensis]|nr:hypothetical protein [Priestia taiwanensis]
MKNILELLIEIVIMPRVDLDGTSPLQEEQYRASRSVLIE